MNAANGVLYSFINHHLTQLLDLAKNSGHFILPMTATSVSFIAVTIIDFFWELYLLYQEGFTWRNFARRANIFFENAVCNGATMIVVAGVAQVAPLCVTIAAVLLMSVGLALLREQAARVCPDEPFFMSVLKGIYNVPKGLYNYLHIQPQSRDRVPDIFTDPVTYGFIEDAVFVRGLVCSREHAQARLDQHGTNLYNVPITQADIIPMPELTALIASYKLFANKE